MCNLWWMSDKVPQGRGVAPVQLLSRITPDLTRMPNLQTLIGNSSKYFLPRVPLSVGLFLKIYMHCGVAAIFTTFRDFVKMISTFPHHWYVYYWSLPACLPPACLLSVDVLETFPFELCCVSRPSPVTCRVLQNTTNFKASGLRARCASIRGET